MGGICGIATTRGAVDPARLTAMSSALVHRGPDSEGALVDGQVGLATRRLAVIDLVSGDQPVANENGRITVAHDGAIYNYRELRGDLERTGHTFSTSSDTEVLAHLYEEHGEHFAERLRGMFAVALWDSEQARLVLARDPYGIKPLYYRETDGELAFASELRAFPRTDIDPDALEAFLAFGCVPAPLTIFRGFRKLRPGHVLVWRDGHIELTRFARPAPVPAADVRADEEAELVEELRARLRDSVQAHLVADVPVGVLLSGGIASAALAGLAAEEASEPLRTFSIGFEERTDQLGDARLVAQRYGTDHRELVLRPDAAVLLPSLAEAFDEPFADPSALAPYLVSKLAAEDVKVALSGEGGNELLGGDYRYAHLLPQQQPTPARRHGWTEIFSADARVELTGRPGSFDPVDLLRARFGETEGSELLARLQDVDLGTYAVDDLLVKTDRASMAHSLEARVPFLDPVVTNFALALRTRHKVRGLRKQVLLHKALAPLLPPELRRRRKRRFSIPAAARPRGELELFARETLSSETLRRQGLFRPEKVARLIDDHVAGRDDLSRQLWGLLAFTLWYERHVEQTPGPLREPRLAALAR
jgi:asparagine synthase (glutamine-hydrolysing)